MLFALDVDDSRMSKSVFLPDALLYLSKDASNDVSPLHTQLSSLEAGQQEHQSQSSLVSRNHTHSDVLICAAGDSALYRTNPGN